MRRRHFLVVFALAGFACSGPRAAIEVEADRTFYVAGTKRVAAELDLLAHDQLGGNIGQYCTRAIFVGQEDSPVEVCYEDLSDGDRRTVHLESVKDATGAVLINMRVRLGDVDVGRQLVGPP